MQSTLFKIRSLNMKVNAIARFAEGTCGIPGFMDYLDLNFGAIPDGPYEKLCDPAAPEKFIRMYAQIAESRLANAVTKLLILGEPVMHALEEIFQQFGNQDYLCTPETLDDAINQIDTFVVDGVPGENPRVIISKTDKKITWKNTVDTHLPYWKKAEGDIKVYYKLQSIYINSLLSESGIKYSTDGETFTLEFEK